MRISCRPLRNLDSVNAFQCADFWTQSQNGCTAQPTTLALQLVDLDRKGCDGPLRFIPIGTIVGLKVRFPNLDERACFSVLATQPYPQDLSIWQVALTSKMIPASGAVQFFLTIDTQTYSWSVQNFMQVEQLQDGMLDWDPKRVRFE